MKKSQLKQFIRHIIMESVTEEMSKVQKPEFKKGVTIPFAAVNIGENVKMNSLEIYRDAGLKAGKASKQKDQGTVSFQTGWFNKAIRLETDPDYALQARKAFIDGYRKESGIINKPEYFREAGVGDKSGKCANCGTSMPMKSPSTICPKCSMKMRKASLDFSTDPNIQKRTSEGRTVGDILGAGYGAKFPPGTKLSTKTTFFPNIPIGTYFVWGSGKLPNSDVWLKDGNDSAKNTSTGKSQPMYGSTLNVTQVDKPKGVDEQTCTGAVAGYSTPFAFSKKGGGAKRAMDVTTRMGYKKVKDISERKR